MDYYEHARSPDKSLLRLLVVLAVGLSVLLHAAFVWWALGFHPASFGDAYYDQMVPRKFRVERVEIDPEVFVESEDLPPAPTARVVPVDLPPELPVAEPVRTAPDPARIDPATLPKADPASQSEFSAALEAARGSATGAMVSELDDIRRQLLESDSLSPARPVIDLPEPGGAGAGDSLPGLRFGSLQGYSQLDDLLAQTGPLAPGTDPIFMPGDFLFDYNRADLREESIEALRKLGTLIQRNPRTTFLIEGHTDSFGSDEYNQTLSELRAQAVKTWLVEEMNVPAEKIRTRGLGRGRLLVPAHESIEGQQLNRRVEIVLEVAE